MSISTSDLEILMNAYSLYRLDESKKYDNSSALLSIFDKLLETLNLDNQKLDEQLLLFYNHLKNPYKPAFSMKPMTDEERKLVENESCGRWKTISKFLLYIIKESHFQKISTNDPDALSKILDIAEKFITDKDSRPDGLKFIGLGEISTHEINILPRLLMERINI